MQWRATRDDTVAAFPQLYWSLKTASVPCGEWAAGNTNRVGTRSRGRATARRRPRRARREAGRSLVATEHWPTDAGARRYEQVAARIGWLIEQGTLPLGGRVPSVRALSRQESVSISTVVQAYRLLEDRGLIEGRPQSGYYV